MYQQIWLVVEPSQTYIRKSGDHHPISIVEKKNHNFTSVFDVQRPFRAKGLRFVAPRRHRPRLKREIKRRASGDLQM